MPHYDYQCVDCGYTFEVFHKISEEPSLECPKCQSSMKKLIGGGAVIIFKGSGFYKTDYCNTKPKEESSKCDSCKAAS